MQVSSSLHFKGFSTLFFPRPVTRIKHGSSYAGQNYIETMWRETKITSSYREVQVTEGKITVNV